MGSERAGNAKAVVLFVFLSVFEFMAFVLLIRVLKPDPFNVWGTHLLSLTVPAGFAFAFIPVLRRIEADYALAAGASAAAFFAVVYGVAPALFSHVSVLVLLALQLSGSLAGFLAVVLLRKIFHRISNKAVVLIPASVLTVWLVSQAFQVILRLSFMYLF